jgi:hypothetical protein
MNKENVLGPIIAVILAFFSISNARAENVLAGR